MRLLPSSTFGPAAIAALAVLALAVPVTASAAPAAELYYERTLMGAANQRCGLFTPEVQAALSAAAAQARSAALRGGASAEAVRGAAERAAAKAQATPCGSRDLAVAAERVRTAFRDYARLTSMDFPGRFADWRARRPGPTAPTGPQWRLVQFAPAGVRPTLFGLAVGTAEGPGATLTAVIARPEALSASTVRLVMRDPARDPQPYLDTLRHDLAGRMPPRALDRVVLAESRAAAPRALLPPTAAGGGAMFQFPASASQAIARLDAREAVALELVYPEASGERVQTAWIEVGDFAAAEAFLAAGRAGR